MANEKAGLTLPGWGNAKDWYNDAINSGYTVGTTPQANSIVVWGDWTSYGHVGYVEPVGENVIHVWDSTGPCIDEEDEEYRQCIINGVSEETDKICRANAKRVACKYNISSSDYTITGYIYLDIAPKNMNTSPKENTNQNNETLVNTPVVKSSNANLSDIKFSSGEIEFNKDILEYNIEVENEVRLITINATQEDEKATVNGIGDYELNTGLNEIKITVTAEDDSIKEYIIKVTRKERMESAVVDNELDTETNDIIEEEPIPKNNNLKIIIFILSICVLIIFTICLVSRKRTFKKNNL